MPQAHTDIGGTRHDFTLMEGDTETFSITKEDSDGNPVDISGWTFWLTIKSDSEDTDANAAVQKKVTSHTDAANGETEIELTSSDTDDLQGDYDYDIQYKDGAGDVVTPLYGTIHFRADVTEATS